jgi:hypothetical protein
MKNAAKGKVRIGKEPPRDPAAFRKSVDFGRGLRGWIFSGSVFSGVGLLALVSIPFGPMEGGTILFKICGACAFGILSFLFFRRYGRERRRRLQLFARGRYTEGKVAAYGRAFSPWKSARDYTLTVEITLSDGTVKRNTIRSAKESLHADHPIGSAIPLLVDDVGGAVLYAGEIGADPEWC